MFALALLGALILATTYWQSWAAPGLANRKENAIQVVAQFTIERGKIFAADGKTVLATNTSAKGERPDALLPPLPDARARRARRRLFDAGAFASGTRAIDERLPHGLEREPEHGRRHPGRQAARPARGRQRSAPHAERARAARRASGARPELRLGRRDRAVDRACAGDGELADLRSEPDRDRLSLDSPRARQLSAGRAAAEPRHPGPLRPGLDVQDRHRRRGARERQVHDGDAQDRSRLLHGVRTAREQLRHDLAVRVGDALPGDPVLDQLVLLRDRQGPRARSDRAGDEGLRLLLAARRSRRPRTSGARAASTRTADSSSPRTRARSTPGDSRSASPSCR